MKFTVTGIRKITHAIEGSSPNDAIGRFRAVTGGAEPTIVNGMNIIGQCDRCHTWIFDGDRECYGLERQLLCEPCYTQIVREQGKEATDERPTDSPTGEDFDEDDHDEWGGSDFDDEDDDL